MYDELKTGGAVGTQIIADYGRTVRYVIPEFRSS